MIELTTIIETLRERCPTFKQNVAGAAEWKELQVRENPLYPAAYVVPLSDQADSQESPNGYRQTVTETFGVIVLADSSDERGQGAIEFVRQVIRPELFRALLAWSPDPKLFSEIEYAGGEVIYLDRARIAYQFEFSYEYYLDASDTWQQPSLEALPGFNGLDIDVGISPDLTPELKAKLSIDLEDTQ